MDLVFDPDTDGGGGDGGGGGAGGSKAGAEIIDAAGDGSAVVVVFGGMDFPDATVDELSGDTESEIR